MAKTASRSSIWIGHVTRRVNDIHKTAEFFKTLGLRAVWQDARMAILELRGGTHLLLFPDESRYKTIPNDDFDLMVEDVENARAALSDKKLKISKIKRDRFHTYFEATDPDGHKWRVNSDHTEGRPV